LTPLAFLASALAWVAAAFSIIGVIQQFFGTILVARFAALEPPPPRDPPPVSVLKPLCGVEPLTELALESFFLLDYPVHQLVFGVQDEADPVLAVVAALRARYPGRDVAVVVSPLLHGSNRKVSNLINMLPTAKYDTLVMSDADNHVPPHFLNRVVAALLEPNVGLVTTIYTAIPGTPHLATAMGANQINYNFLPGALLARALGRQDCLGVTMALTRQTLAAVGGLIAVANHLADDQVLGRLVRARGQALTLAQVVPATTVPEADFRALFHHELRWARTIRALVPLPYATSALQFSLVWAALAILFSAGAWPSLLLFPVVLLLRYVLARRIDATLGLAKSGDAWLFLLRDLVSAIIFVASYCGNRVDWRGQVMHADAGRAPPPPDIARALPTGALPAKTLDEVE
jgi:ceramide glucosyltransferase